MIEHAPIHHGKLKFGVFEVDLASGDLRKSGIRIKLQTQPFKLLTILLSQPGEVVTREELRQQIWGSETVVNFDHSLGTAVNKVREALGDSAEHPRYIETLSKRGYRFVFPVEVVKAEGTKAPNAAPFRIIQDTSPVETSLSPAPEPLFAPANDASILSPGPAVIEPKRSLNRSATPFIVGVSVLAVLAGLLLWPGEPDHPSALPFTQITSSDSIFPGDIGVEKFSTLVTDGARVYFSKIEKGKVILAYSAISGGEVHTLVAPSEIPAPALADISPDGSKLLVVDQDLSLTERTLWIVPTSGGAARKLISGPGHAATWLPDGKTILFASGHTIFSTLGDGQKPETLATLPGIPFWMRSSPDGSRVRFTVIESATHTTSLWELALNGNKLQQLLPGWSDPHSECCGSWSRDGKNYIFQSNGPEGSNLWILPEKRFLALRAPQPFQLTSGPLSYLSPVPSRQDNKIFLIGAHLRSQLHRLDAATGQFAPYLPEIGMADRTEFSKDGTHVAWISSNDGALWQSSLDGSQRLQVTSRPMEVFMMRWSPDGSKIAFMGREPGKTWKIYTIPSNGGAPQEVLEDPRSEADPDWSPDGKTIIYGRTPEYMAEDSTPKAIQIVDLKNKTPSTLPGSEGLFSPRWSPDGRYVVALPLDQRKLMLYDMTTKRWTEIASGRFNNPVWSKNGAYIYFQSLTDEGRPICRTPVPSTRIERVADFSNLQPGTTVRYWGVTADDLPIVSFHFSMADVYAVDWKNR
jgi:Tol biopolymer transport system component/DNA-binding winged helix-turn-helix (wHTH) protein